MLGLRGEPAERGALAVKLGLVFYDHLSRERRTMPRHVFRGRAETARLWPDLPPSVRFSATYHDAWISYPERLGIELVRDGLAAHPGALAINHLAASGRDGGRVVLADALTGDTLAVEADVILNATGAWVDETNRTLAAEGDRPEPLVGGTKGSHLILDHPELTRALNGHMIYFENVDGRVCIAFPYLGRVLLGSTDIRVDRPGDVRCEDEEVDYILKSLSYVFPGIAGRTRADRLSLQRRSAAAAQRRELHRPHLARPFRRGDRGRAADPLPRRRQVDDLPRVRRPGRRPGAGAPRHARGRWAPRTCASVAASAIPTDAAGREALVAGLAREFGVSRERATHAVDHYGTDAGRVLAFCRRRAGRRRRRQRLHRKRAPLPDPRGARPHARRPAAAAHRRSRSPARSPQRSSPETAAILADELGWSPQRAADEERAFRALLARDHGLTDGILAERDRSSTRSLECA